MFIELNKINDKSIKINTEHITFIEEDVVTFTNGSEVALDSASVKALTSLLFVEPEESNFQVAIQHKPSEIGTFLTKLHNLLGGRGEAKLTTDRKARLITRMKDFSQDELIMAATNLGSDEFMQGGNDNGKRYGTIDYLLRTSANVNKWLEEQPEKKKPGMF